MRDNIRNALSINGGYIEPIDLKEPIISTWITSNYKVLQYSNWYYAVVLRQDVQGETIAKVVDAKYKGDYHNDTMQTKPYDESIKKIGLIISEFQLRSLIKESIKRVLNIL